MVIDVRADRRGEYFDLQLDSGADVAVLDVQPRDRHLLLMTRQPAEQPHQADVKDKFLCGHDERHWFVAAVPEVTAVSSVVTAKDSLKPAGVRQLERGAKGKRSRRHRRRTPVFIRQGEWFFVPAPHLQPDPMLVLRNEPITRGRGKPHTCEFLFRQGGTTVYVCRFHPQGLTENEYGSLLRAQPEASGWSWRTMRRDPRVYVRGKVTHADHATIYLPEWRLVEMNTENRSRAMAHVAFLD